MRGRRWVPVTAVVAGVLTAAACSSGSAGSSAAGSSGGASSLAGQTITLYNGQHEQTPDALVKAFEKQTGVTVKVRSDDEDVLAQQIQQEGSRSPADVFYTENTPPLVRLDEKGLLAPVSAAALADVPAQDSAAGPPRVGVAGRPRRAVQRPPGPKPSPPPTSLPGLGRPK